MKAQNLGTRFLLLLRPKTARGILWPALQSTVSLRKLPRRASVIRLRRLQGFKRSSGSDCRIFQLEAVTGRRDLQDPVTVRPAPQCDFWGSDADFADAYRTYRTLSRTRPTNVRGTRVRVCSINESLADIVINIITIIVRVC